MNGLITQKEEDNGYSFIIDSNVLTISKFINYISKKYEVYDLDVDNENIDDVIIKLYNQYKI